MNIEQLESFNLADAVKFHDNLNPLIWDKSEHLHPEIRDQLLEIAADFSDFLGVHNLNLKDITISGSNAAFSYTPHSDIDLHLIVDLGDEAHKDIYRELFDAKKFIYNTEHKITIKDIPVELYVQDANEEHHSQGIYSILNNDWIQIPRRKQSDIDDVSVRSKYKDLSKRIKEAIKSKSLAQMTSVMDKIKEMRGAGLASHGEFGPENLAFKLLRNKGDLKKLQTARKQAKSLELSLKERQPQQPTIYGFGPDYIEEVGITPDGTNPTTAEFTNEEQLDEVGITPDGTNPTTCMFTNESDNKKTIIQDFINFCINELELKKEINLRLRRDPQWSVRNKTFGRYNDTTNELEVGLGGRHIMDILRTIAHELVHQKQNEVAIVPDDAGEDGSPYENEANARAGVLMRKYGSEHPELFALSNIQTTSETADNDQENGTAPLGAETPPQFPLGTVKVDVSDVYDWYKLGQNISNLDHIDPKSLGKGPPQTILAFGNEPEEHKYMKQLKRLGLKTHDVDPPWYHDVDESDEMLSEASGYIPTAAQANDPRFEMALTVDIRPGAIGKNANKLLLNTDSQGHPQELRPDGVVKRMMEELELYKRNYQ
jgi:hypothetical protein